MTAAALAMEQYPHLEAAMRLARAIAHKMALRKSGCDAEELTSVGYLAVVEALGSYDPALGLWQPRVQFLVRMRIQDHFRLLDIMSRDERKTATATEGAVFPLDGPLVPSRTDPAFREIESRNTAEYLMNQLPLRWRRVVEDYYWGEMTTYEIAKDRKISEGRVSQIHARSLERMWEATREGR